MMTTTRPQAPAPPGAAAATSPALRWDIDIPLLTNVHMLRAMAGVTLGSAALVAALVSLMLAVQGDWSLIPSIAGLFVAAGLGFLLLALLVMGLVFGNRLRARFSVDDHGVGFQTRDRVARAGNRAALVMGLLLGRPGAAGSGLLAMSQEQQALGWAGSFRAEFDAAHHSIALCNRWRTLLRVYCTPDNYAAVCARIREQMARHGTAGRAMGRSPVGGYLGRTVLAVLACVPMFLLAPVYGHGLFLPLLLMCFAIATVWFVRHLAWVVLGCSATLVANLLMAGLAMRESSFSRGTHFRRYEVLSGDDWALTALAMLGLAYLAWHAVQTLRRRAVPALEGDLQDAQAP